MSFIGKSHDKVHYEFRPAKQVERRMLLHAFHEMRDLGYPISSYEYTGLGSIYFVDFVLFHRYLGLKRMTSVEGDRAVEKRVKYNCPYGFVTVVNDDMAAQIARLSQERRHILWLDFDSIMTCELLAAVKLATMQLSMQSVLLVTVDVEPPGRADEGPTKWNPKVWMKHYKEEAEGYLWKGISPKDFALEELPRTNARIIQAVIDEGLEDRDDVKFIGMFSFLYADGHKMLSVGGMIGCENDERRIRSLDRKELFFLRDNISSNPVLIRVPLVTRKERHCLDQNMPCDDKWSPADFEMKEDDVRDYKSIYRYYPAYTEMLL